MIQYKISIQDLEKAVAKVAPKWLAEAAVRTGNNLAAKKYCEPPKPNWSKIKSVFIDLQFGKCAYCERKLGKGKKTKVEWDLEHFRPKSAVATCPTTTHVAESSRYAYGFATGTSSNYGYFGLAYNLKNYAVGCKTCNSSLKSTYFPVCNDRQLTATDFNILATETPLIIFPIGTWGEDPGNYLAFDGITPIPNSTDDLCKQRGRVTIDFFLLDIREELLEERSEVITKLWLAYIAVKSGVTGADLILATRTLELPKSDACRHANCARCFVALLATDEARAQQIAIAAGDFLNTKHPAL